ncbi:hypothetical protein ACFQ2B_02030 [Streptomyces stramineus]
MYEKEIADLLGLPGGIVQAALIPTAFTLGTDFRPAARQPRRRAAHRLVVIRPCTHPPRPAARPPARGADP